MSGSHDSSTPTSSDSHGSPISSTSDPPSITSNALVLQPPTMPPANRSRRRNVHIYDFTDSNSLDSSLEPKVLLGGLILTDGITNANLYSMLDVFIFCEESLFRDLEKPFFLGDEGPFFLEDEEPFSLLNEEGTRVEKDDHPLQPGNYYIVSINTIQVSNERYYTRTTSIHAGTRVQAFCHAVCSRDRRCVITGEEVIEFDDNMWWGMDAAHIFPLALEGIWKAQNYSRWISIPAVTGGPINSVQNGLLLRSDIHHLFDNYGISINPDDNYKIVSFVPDRKNIAGKYLDQTFLDDPERPVDELLRWHFRQAVLANMRRAGEPMFEHDFPPGSDMVSVILMGPKAAERMEFELFGRLAAQVEIDYPEVAQVEIGYPEVAQAGGRVGIAV